MSLLGPGAAQRDRHFSARMRTTIVAIAAALLPCLASTALAAARSRGTVEGNNTVPILVAIFGLHECPAALTGSTALANRPAFQRALALTGASPEQAAAGESLVGCVTNAPRRVALRWSASQAAAVASDIRAVVGAITKLAATHRRHAVYIVGYDDGGATAALIAWRLPSWVHLAAFTLVEGAPGAR